MLSQPNKPQQTLAHTVCETIFALWEAGTEWPQLDKILIRLEKLGHRFQTFDALKKALPPGTIRKQEFGSNDIRVTLTPRGVRLCERGKVITDVLAAALRHAYELFKKDPFGPTPLTKADVRSLLDTSDEGLVTRVSQVLLDWAVWTRRGDGLANAEWKHWPGLAVVTYANVASFDDYLRAEERRTNAHPFGEEHVNLLQEIVTHWRPSHAWPNLVHFLLTSKEPGTVYQQLQELSQDYWQHSVLYQDATQTAEIRLWLEGIIASKAAEPELALIHRLVQVCCTHVLEHEREQRLTAEEAAAKLQEDPENVKQVGFLLEHRDYDLGMNVYRAGTSWFCIPGREILQYQNTKDFSALWARRLRLQRAKAGIPMQRVFYSWQSDLPAKTTKYFIEDALKRAIKKVNKDSEVELEPAPDRDTKGLAGSPNIVDAIFTKIQECAVFVCDVSIVNAGQKRLTPNPNVLFEAGYALAKKSWNRVILVANTAYGEVEALPFDLRSRRVTTYTLPESSDEKAEERQRLVDTLVQAITVALQAPATTWEEKDYSGSFFNADG